MASGRKQRATRKGHARFILGGIILLAVLAVVFRWPFSRTTQRVVQTNAPISTPTPPAPPRPQPDEATVFATYGGSPSCKACHLEAYQLWENSHHGLAERGFKLEADAAAFRPNQQIRHGTQQSEARIADGRPELVAVGLDGKPAIFAVERVLGVDPLRQYMVPAAGGRFQVSELAFDPKQHDWFDVYGDEDRKPGEWGHWTGRGMTWNSMCATCHNTRLRKNYHESTDSYRTTKVEMGVGCESCHGPMADHNAWQTAHPGKSGDPTLKPIGREKMFFVCGSCHSRRAELTGDFHPGENFFDHHALSIPDETDLFYPDGQIRDEDYEFNAFLGSRMHAAGVRCLDCHEPHSGKTRVAGNNLCMICHAGPTPPAPKIDLLTHSRHKTGERGDRCVDCHMPQTVYMQRHGRHDHGFTIPDPQLTKELQIPNACNRCHADRTPDWALEALQKWYGSREHPARARARTIARARSGSAEAIPGLLQLLRTETNGYWRAVSANLVRRWVHDPMVTGALLSSAGDADPMVRAVSVRALEPLSRLSAPAQTILQKRLDDPVRAVRIDAAWSLRTTLETNSLAGADLLAYLHHTGDQPAGALQAGIFYLDRNDQPSAMKYFRRSAAWDTNSAPPRHALAIGLSLEGKHQEAVTELQIACKLAPRDAEYRFKLGLALNEVGKIEEARAALEEAVKLEPSFAQAWYNLGLAYNATGKTDAAIESLLRAESLDSRSAQIPYARATILARAGKTAEARTAARRALELEPAYGQAENLLRSLDR